MSDFLSSLGLPEERTLHRGLSYFHLVSGIFTLIALVIPYLVRTLEQHVVIPNWVRFVSSHLKAPYGRYSQSKGWGPLIPAQLGWILMESPSFLVAGYCFMYGDPEVKNRLVNRILLITFCLHYINRSLIFPFRMCKTSPMPISIMFMAWTFCTVNGYVQGRFLSAFQSYDDSWLSSPQFIIGMSTWALGFFINVHSDGILLALRKPSAQQSADGPTRRYFIPRGGMFEYVSGANYFGEIIEWIGFGIACGALPGLTFAWFTFCNIGPRAISHHLWYLDNFPEYPKNRKALIPFIF